MLVARGSFFVFCYVLIVDSCLVFIVRCLFVVGCWLFIVGCLLLVVYYWLFVVGWRWLDVVVVCCVLFVD